MMDELNRQKVFYVILESQIFQRWRYFGVSHGLTSDSEIASFLIQSYENSMLNTQFGSHCANCKSLSPQLCSFNKSPLRQKHPRPYSQDQQSEQQPYLHQPQGASPKGTLLPGGFSDCETGVQKHLSTEDILTSKPDQVDVTENKSTSESGQRDAGNVCEKDSVGLAKGEPRREILAGGDNCGEEGSAGEAGDESSDGLLDLKVVFKQSSDSSAIINQMKRNKRKLPTPRKSYLCQDCGAPFAQSSSLKRHMRTHTGEKPFTCKECGAAFTCKNYLIIHMRRHSGEKPYLCQECGSAYSQGSSLTSHMRTHTGERPYHCTQCGGCFSTSSSLTRHIRKHTGEKPYKCEVCGAGFVQSGSLKEHLQKHTGIKPYKCNLCGGGFSSSTHLRRHQKNVKCTKKV